MRKNTIITVQNINIGVAAEVLDDYIGITNITGAKSEQPKAADNFMEKLLRKGECCDEI